MPDSFSIPPAQIKGRITGQDTCFPESACLPRHSRCFQATDNRSKAPLGIENGSKLPPPFKNLRRQKSNYYEAIENMPSQINKDDCRVVGSGVRTPAAAFAEMPRRLDPVFSEPSIQVAIQRKLWGLWNRPLSDNFIVLAKSRRFGGAVRKQRTGPDSGGTFRLVSRSDA